MGCKYIQYIYIYIYILHRASSTRTCIGFLMFAVLLDWFVSVLKGTQPTISAFTTAYSASATGYDVVRLEAGNAWNHNNEYDWNVSNDCNHFCHELVISEWATCFLVKYFPRTSIHSSLNKKKLLQNSFSAFSKKPTLLWKKQTLLRIQLIHYAFSQHQFVHVVVLIRLSTQKS